MKFLACLAGPSKLIEACRSYDAEISAVAESSAEQELCRSAGLKTIQERVTSPNFLFIEPVNKCILWP